MAPKGEGIVVHGVMYCWFTDVSGLGVGEQERRLMHPDPPKKEEELAEYVETWQDEMKRVKTLSTDWHPRSRSTLCACS